MPTNRAAWLSQRKSVLTVGPAPYSAPQKGQILIKNNAVSINPLDWIVQIGGDLAYRWLRYPTVLGSDVAGEVVEVGSEVTTFKVGDRVVAHCVGSDKDVNTPKEGGFQSYTAVLEDMAAQIPESMTYEEAVVLPLALSTAACALYQKDLLGLELPELTSHKRSEVLLVWGGSTSVGVNAIQLAIASGYQVVSTASPHNFDFVRSFGAKLVFDYSSPDVVEQLINALKGKTIAGAIAIGETGARSCVKVLSECKGNKFVAVATPPISFSYLAKNEKSQIQLLKFAALLISKNIALGVLATASRVKFKYIFGTTLKNNGVGRYIYRQYLPRALEEKIHIPAPPPRVVGHGLEAIQEALDIAKAGVSAEKIVVRLD
ncbi:MAG: zinc-binding alcohol dehydrogenase family protein [Actinomycetota bacterium]|nr:zinc-binding alcohol dehydrogenase family protein [Actinomycetota bacterium]